MDDDNGRDLNARITFTCPKTDHYRIVATTLKGSHRSATGRLLLKIQEK